MATDRLAGAVLASSRLPDLLAGGTRALINGVWLGLLSDSSLRAVDRRYYDREPAYRTVDWNERGLFGWERQMLDEHFEPSGRIVVAACGGGREVLALLEAGYDAVGFEPHPDLVDFAGEFLAARGHPARVHAGPRDEFPPDAGRCAGVIVGWGGYSLIHGRERRIRFLSGARDRLSAGGRPVLMSFFHRPDDTRQLRWTRSTANALRRLRRAAPVELGDTLAPNLVHVFSQSQLAEEVAEAGLELASYRITGPADEATSYASAVARVP